MSKVWYNIDYNRINKSEPINEDATLHWVLMEEADATYFHEKVGSDVEHAWSMFKEQQAAVTKLNKFAALVLDMQHRLSFIFSVHAAHDDKWKNQLLTLAHDEDVTDTYDYDIATEYDGRYSELSEWHKRLGNVYE